MASRTGKSLAGIRCFLRPREWFCLGTEHLLLLLCISSQWTRRTVVIIYLLGVRQLWLNLQTENNFCRHIYGCFCWLSHIFCEGTTQPNHRNKENCVKKICSCRAPTRPKFSHISLRVQTPNPWVQALET